jgi:hypothetical protein
MGLSFAQVPLNSVGRFSRNGPPTLPRSRRCRPTPAGAAPRARAARRAARRTRARRAASCARSRASARRQSAASSATAPANALAGITSETSPQSSASCRGEPRFGHPLERPREAEQPVDEPRAPASGTRPIPTNPGRTSPLGATRRSQAQANESPAPAAAVDGGDHRLRERADEPDVRVVARFERVADRAGRPAPNSFRSCPAQNPCPRR